MSSPLSFYSPNCCSPPPHGFDLRVWLFNNTTEISNWSSHCLGYTEFSPALPDLVAWSPLFHKRLNLNPLDLPKTRSGDWSLRGWSDLRISTQFSVFDWDLFWWKENGSRIKGLVNFRPFWDHSFVYPNLYQLHLLSVLCNTCEIYLDNFVPSPVALKVLLALRQ